MALVGLADCPTTIESEEFELQVKKHKWYTMPLYKRWIQMRSLRTNCGRLSKKTLHHNDEVECYISKALTQRLERPNGCLRQQTGRWHRQQNKFGKVWELSKNHLAFSHHLLQLDLGAFACAELLLRGRADLTAEPWTWLDIAVYSTLF